MVSLAVKYEIICQYNSFYTLLACCLPGLLVVGLLPCCLAGLLFVTWFGCCCLPGLLIGLLSYSCSLEFNYSLAP
jgi:hypothetical protein